MEQRYAAGPRQSGEALRLSGVTKVYAGVGNPVVALNDVSVSFAAGSFTAVMGPSGSGKSTMLQCAAGLDVPNEGEVVVAGARFPKGSENEVTRFRRARIGFVFQQFNLVPHLTVMQNVVLPLRLARRTADRKACATILARLGLGALAERLPAELSGGQQQRVAIARALASRPAVLFADEPTGALDSTSGREVLVMLREAVDQFGQTVVMVTHDPVAASYADEVLFLADGSIVDRQAGVNATSVAQRMTRLGEQAARPVAVGE